MKAFMKAPPMPEFQTLDYRVDGGIAIATFSRPDKMNTFGLAMMQDLLDLFDLTDGDDAVRAVILTGSGRAFCAGADLGQGGETFHYKPGGRPGDIDVDGVRRDLDGLQCFFSESPCYRTARLPPAGGYWGLYQAPPPSHAA